MKISKAMCKCIQEMKIESLELVKSIPLMQMLRISRKATKHKTLEFHVINIGKPAIKVFINGSIFKSYIYSNSEWTEE